MPHTSPLRPIYGRLFRVIVTNGPSVTSCPHVACLAGVSVHLFDTVDCTRFRCHTEAQRPGFPKGISMNSACCLRPRSEQNKISVNLQTSQMHFSWNENVFFVFWLKFHRYLFILRNFLCRLQRCKCSEEKVMACCKLLCGFSLQWRHNEHDGVSNHQPHDCLLNRLLPFIYRRLFRRRSKKAPKLRVTGLCVGNSPVIGEFPAQMGSNAENVSIWWRHHVLTHLCINDGATYGRIDTSPG